MVSWGHLTDSRADKPRETASFSRNNAAGLRHLSTIIWASLVAQRVINLPAMQETWVRSLGQEDVMGEGNGNPLQYSCLENPMDREAWWATAHGVAKSQILMSS